MSCDKCSFFQLLVAIGVGLEGVRIDDSLVESDHVISKKIVEDLWIMKGDDVAGPSGLSHDEMISLLGLEMKE